VDVSLLAWLVILFSILAANLPFMNERLFAVVPVGKDVKPLWMRIIELTVLYLLVRGLGYLLEARIGNVFPQGWEFYAITACLFIVLAFPGFVLCYFHKRRNS
jgi:hypothetical protein